VTNKGTQFSSLFMAVRANRTAFYPNTKINRKLKFLINH